MNETEAAILSGTSVYDVAPARCPELCLGFVKQGAKNVVITLGKHGAYYATLDESNALLSGHVAATYVIVKDTTSTG